MSAEWYKIPQREPITDRLPLFFQTSCHTKNNHENTKKSRKNAKRPESCRIFVLSAISLLRDFSLGWLELSWAEQLGKNKNNHENTKKHQKTRKKEQKRAFSSCFRLVFALS